MFLRRKATSWSAILLRDELLHAGIRHSRKPLTECGRADGAAATAPAETSAAAPAGTFDRRADQVRPLGW